MSYAASVTKDDKFFYGSNGLYVEVTEGRSYLKHRHGRAEPSQLYDLLTYEDRGPVLTKKGIPAKRQPPKHVDETGHFYCAQLLHYGVKPLKTKAAAKKQLLSAFGSGITLEVPSDIIRLEKELKTLYERNNTQAKARREKEKRERDIAETKRLEALRKDQERIKAVYVAASGTSATTSSKKRKLQGSEDLIASKTKKKKGADSSSSNQSNLRTLDLAGSWKVTCPCLAEMYGLDYSEMTLKMSTSRNNLNDGHLWMSFDFGVISGIMRSSALPLPANESLSFVWRGFESGEGQMTFQRENKGTITFLGNGKFVGVINGDYIPDPDAPFFGTQDQGNLRHVMWTKYVRQWKGTWRDINMAAWEAANVARWGKWVSDEGCHEGPAESDTTEAFEESEPEYYGEEDYGEDW